MGGGGGGGVREGQFLPVVAGVDGEICVVFDRYEPVSALQADEYRGMTHRHHQQLAPLPGVELHPQHRAREPKSEPQTRYGRLTQFFFLIVSSSGPTVP